MAPPLPADVQGRQLRQVAPATEVPALIQMATVQANALITALDISHDASTNAVQILSTAVSGSQGPVVTATVLTELSAYVEDRGCTPSVQQVILDALESYGGSTTPLVSALRGLDVYNTDVGALGGCLAVVSSTPLP